MFIQPEQTIMSTVLLHLRMCTIDKGLEAVRCLEIVKVMSAPKPYASMETQARTTQRKLCKFVSISQFTQFTIGQKVLSVDSQPRAGSAWHPGFDRNRTRTNGPTDKLGHLLGDDQDEGLGTISEKHPLQPCPENHDEWGAPVQDQNERKPRLWIVWRGAG